MTSRFAKPLAAVAAATLIAVAAFALGERSDGSAVAKAGAAQAQRAHPMRAFRMARRHARVHRLATRLGVQPADLRTALREVRQARRDARLDQLARELAPKLGLPVAKVRAALG
jgi:hypothetical protein